MRSYVFFDSKENLVCQIRPLDAVVPIGNMGKGFSQCAVKLI
jgi:hypothetical protein